MGIYALEAVTAGTVRVSIRALLQPTLAFHSITLAPAPLWQELTYDYQFVAFEQERWECQCGEPTCRRFLGVSRKEVVNALALEAFGVRTELRHNEKADGAADGAAAAPGAVRRTLTLHPSNPAVFHNCQLPIEIQEGGGGGATSDALQQILSWDFNDVDAEWVRYRRLFIVGSERPAPNAFDESRGSRYGKRSKRARRGHVADSEVVDATAGTVPGAESDSTAVPPPEWSDKTPAWHRRCWERTFGTGRGESEKTTAGDSPQHEQVAPPPTVEKSGRKRRRGPEATTVAAQLRSPPRARVGLRRSRYAVLLALQRRLCTLLDGGGVAAPVASERAAAAAHAHLAERIWPALRADSAEPSTTTSAALPLPSWQPSRDATRGLASDLPRAAAAWVCAEYLRGDDVTVGLVNQRGATDSNDVVCAGCLCGGSLVCCDTCPRAYHVSCCSASPQDLQSGRAWSCPACRVAARAARRAAAEAGVSGGAAATQRAAEQQRAEAIVRLAAWHRADRPASIHVKDMEES